MARPRDVGGGSRATLVPPVWFMAFYLDLGANHAAIVESPCAPPSRSRGGRDGFPVYIFPAACLGAGPANRGGTSVRRTDAGRHRLSRVLVPGVQRRTLVSFTIVSLARSHDISCRDDLRRRRHRDRCQPAGDVGLSRSAASPNTDAVVLLLPLVMMMFLIAGSDYVCDPDRSGCELDLPFIAPE